MAKKKKQNQETTIENYYDLKVKETDELVAALKGETTGNEKPLTTDIHEITGEEVTKRRKKSQKL
jgi:5-enolpyruvylshikimate-3-phosphate synthase